jgi:hypothetical protein
MNTTGQGPDIAYDVSRTILSSLSLSDALLARRISPVWKAEIDGLMEEAWKAVRQRAGSPTSSQSLAGMIAHVTKEAFNACPQDQEVSACELFGRLSRLFKKTYGIGLDLTRSLDSLTEQIQGLQIQQQPIHDRDLCAVWPEICAQLPSTALSAPPPTATANAVRAWMMDSANAVHLTRITFLYLKGLQLKTIPPEIGQLSKLSDLELPNNQITIIPDAIGQLSQLSGLNLSNNQITSIPDAIGKLSNLTHLYLYNNQITSIPDAIGKISKLLTLSLGDNQITSIPDAIGQLSKLTLLYLYNNQITIIPDAIGQLSQLSCLYLNHNQITIIPDAIGKLSKLIFLSLHDNQITSIPDAIGQLSKLSDLDLSNNPIFSIAKAVLTSPRIKDRTTPRTFAEALQWDAKSALAKLCLAIMQDRDQAMQNMPALLSQLSPEERGRIFFHVWDLNKRPQTSDTQWGEHHALDNPEIFMRAVHRSIVGHLEALPEEQSAVVYRKIGQLAGKSEIEALLWGKVHATENVPRLADALSEDKNNP